MYCKIWAIFLLTFQIVICSDTGCEDSQNHFANTCFRPSPSKGLDYAWVQTSEPEGGWFVTSMNDLGRLHITENLKGQLLTLEDNFDDPCFRVKLVPNGDTYTVEVYGYNNLTFHWDCDYSQDYFGMFLCKQANTTASQSPSEFHENFNVFHTYSDNKKFAVLAYCFPNGQVAWSSISVNPTLTEEQNKAVSEHIQSLGFSDDNTVITLTESCIKKDS